MNKLKRQLLAGPYLVWIIGFIVLPLIMILYYAFVDETGRFTLSNLSTITSPINTHAMVLSLELGVAATVICLLLAYPLAMILNNLKIKNQSLVVFIFMLPMWMNFLLRILAWKLLLNKNGVLNTLLMSLGLEPVMILNTPAAVVFGMVYEYLPFMILPIYNSMARIKKDYIEAAHDLGANEITIFFKIIIPLTLSGIISGIVMVFVPALTTFVISTILGGSKILLIGNVIEQEFTQASNWNLGSGLSIVLMIFIIISMIISAILDKDGEGTLL